jgi:hypothetical protein
MQLRNGTKARLGGRTHSKSRAHSDLAGINSKMWTASLEDGKLESDLSSILHIRPHSLFYD